MTSAVRIAVLVSRIRVEEKLLLTALEASGAAIQVINDDDLVLPVADRPLGSSETLRVYPIQADVVLERSVSAARGIYALRVLEAHGGGDALLLCEQHTTRIDLLLTDVIMPRMSGRQLVERLAVLRPGLKVLYMSGYAENAIVRHGVIEEGIAYVQKPFRPDDLLRQIRLVLESSPSAARA